MPVVYAFLDNNGICQILLNVFLGDSRDITYTVQKRKTTAFIRWILSYKYYDINGNLYNADMADVQLAPHRWYMANTISDDSTRLISAELLN